VRAVWTFVRWYLGLPLLVGAPFASLCAQSTWNLNANENWNTAANWSPALVPAVGASVTLGNIITANRVISVNTSPTISALTINDNNNYTLSRTSGGGTELLTFDAAGGGPATITILNSGSPTISTSGNRLRVNLVDNTVINHTGTGTFTISTVIQGAGSLTQNGTGTTLLSGANIFSGGLAVNGGTVQFGNNAAAGTGTLTLNGGTILAASASRTLSNAVTVGGNFTVGGTQALLLSGAMDLGGGQRGVTTSNSALTTFSGVVSGSGGLTKEGSGVLVLQGGNAFTGNTIVNAGTLRASSAGTAFGANSAVTLANVSGATLDLAGFNTSIGSLAGGGASGGNVTMGAGTLTLGGNNASTSYAGILSGTGGLVKVGNGTQTLTGTNTYSGATTISAGALRIANANALGSTAAGTAVSSGAALELTGGIAVPVAETLSLAGSGIGGGGALRSISGNNTWIGNITLTAAAEIENAAASTTLTLGSSALTESINNSGNTLTIDGPGNTFMNAALTGAGGIVKNGGGTLTFFADENFYTGTTTINDGVLEMDTITGLNGSIKGTSVLVGDGLGSAGSAVLRNGPLTAPIANEMINDAATITFQRDGLWTLNNQNETVTALNMTGGQVTTGTGLLTLSAATPVATSASSDTASISGNLRLSGGGTKTFSVADGSAATDLSISAVISEPFYTSLQKTGAGTLELSGNNLFTGDWSVSSGVLVAASSGALGSAATFNNIVASGAALRLTGGIALTDSNVFISGSGPDGSGAIRNLSGANSWAGTVTLNAASTITSDAGSSLDINGPIAVNHALTVGGAGNTLASGSIYGAGGITKSGSGTLTLDGAGAVSNAGGVTIAEGTVALAKASGANTFTGGSFVVGDGSGTDTLRLDAANQIADFQAVTVNSSGVFNLNNFNETLSGLNMTGGSVTTGAGALTLTSASALTSSASATSATIAGNLNLTAFASTLNVADGAAAADVNVSAAVSGSANLVKAGAGTLVLSGSSANTLSGSTTVNGGTLELAKSSGVTAIAGSAITVNSGGTLLLGSANQINDAANLTLNGGTFSTGSAAGFSETLGTLTLSGSSSIDLGTTAHLLQFADSSALSGAWSGSLTIYGWTGLPASSGTSGQIFFGASASGLTSSQLSMVSFDGFGSGAILLTNGELVPVAVPEAEVVLAALLVLGAVAWREWNARRGSPACRGCRV